LTRHGGRFLILPGQEVLRVNFQRQCTFWIAAVVALALVLWLLGDILLPFVAGLAVAYLLDPLADRLERVGMSRTWAAVVILMLFLIILLLAILLLAPVLAGQLRTLAENVPGYIDRIQNLIAGPGQDFIRSITGSNIPNVRESIGGLVAEGASWLGNFLTQLWAGGAALISLISLFVVTPVVAFYMLVDWDAMVDTVDGWLPLHQRETIRELFREIDYAVSRFVRGQALVCLLLGIFYATGLTLVGLNFGLLIGLGAGFISFIPYVGSLTGLLVAGGVGLAQFWPDWVMIGAVLAVFFVGQFIEGNILSPNLVGRSVGLHPVWLMFALFAFGALFGFVGLLIAVPLAAAVGVLVRFALRRYLASPLYTGEAAEPPQ